MGSCLSTSGSPDNGQPSLSECTFIYGCKDKKMWASIRSEEERECAPCKVTFVNASDSTLILCWVQGSYGKLVHYVPIHPLDSIKDNSVTNESTQYTRSGHTFVVFALSGIETKKPVHLEDVEEADFRALYRPLSRIANEEHILTIANCGKCSLEVLEKSNRKLIDNTSKKYSAASSNSYSGFRLLCDANVTAEDVEVLIADLIEVEKLLPPHALELLQRTRLFTLTLVSSTATSTSLRAGCTPHTIHEGAQVGCATMASAHLMKGL